MIFTFEYGSRYKMRVFEYAKLTYYESLKCGTFPRSRGGYVDSVVMSCYENRPYLGVFNYHHIESNWMFWDGD